MLKSKHHKIIYPLFKKLTLFLINRNFNSVTIVGDFYDTGNSVLTVANHVSWWDGFWIVYLNLKVMRRKFHFMMLENQLRKHWYFQYTGGYSIKKQSKSMIDSIDYTIELLEKKDNMVFVFPQGEITSMHNHHIKFEKGIDRIIPKANPKTQVLLVANFVDYFSDIKPNLYIYIKNISLEDVLKSSLEIEYNLFYTRALEIQKNRLS
jgi:1-acyl-sn-glycerol-3-phosphate acyltransferase